MLFHPCCCRNSHARKCSVQAGSVDSVAHHNLHENHKYQSCRTGRQTFPGCGSNPNHKQLQAHNARLHTVVCTLALSSVGGSHNTDCEHAQKFCVKLLGRTVSSTAHSCHPQSLWKAIQCGIDRHHHIHE